MIEVLAVIVILVIIVAIAIPNISASLDRQTCKTIVNKTKLIESAAQFYVSDYRNYIVNTTLRKNTSDTSDDNTACKITIDNLKSKYITEDDLKDGNNKKIEGFVVYDNSDETYTFCFESANSCKENDTTICNTSLVCK